MRWQSTPRVRRERFAALVREHYGAVLAFAHRRGQPHLAVDVARETFVVAWHEFAGVPLDARPWLLRVASGVLSARVGGTLDWSAVLDRLAGLSDEPSPAALRFRAELDRLSSIEVEALILVAWDGLTPARAAVVAGCSPGAFRVRLLRGRARFGAAYDAAQPSVADDHSSATGPGPE